MVDCFKPGEAEWVAYGVSVRNYSGDIRSTVAYEELTSLAFNDNEISIDIVTSHSYNRPKLQGLIESAGSDNCIVLYSIDSLLVGNKNDGLEYYKRMLDKGVNLIVYNMSGKWARTSDFSISRDELAKNPELKKLKYNALVKYYENKKGIFDTRRVNHKIKNEYFFGGSPFIDIYYAYESYQIDLPTTLELLKDYCGITSERTLRNIVQQYEKTIFYPDDFNIFCEINPYILDLPKRCGLIPDEFFELKKLVDDYVLQNPKIVKGMSDKAIFCEACKHSDIITVYEIYHRWDLTYMKKPKPRKPVLRDFDINEFKKKFKSINE